MHVIGTAGHVDHGKSSLVKALTGIHPDRLKEEIDREMTIDLGFAWLTLSNGDVAGIVDMPGHRDFIENMLAGVGGIDAVLLVVAADEGVMPQTREHLAIIDLLQIKKGLIVLTKTDLVHDPEWLNLAKEDIRKTVGGTTLAEVPILPVSAVTGEGMEELKQALSDLLITDTKHVDLGRPRLPIDRVFTITGFGTVVTGTLLDGALEVGQEVMILPKEVVGRIRGLQSYKTKHSQIGPGTRTAVNLSGINPHQIKRGDVLTLPGKYIPTNAIHARVRILKDSHSALKDNSEIKLFLGAAEFLARVKILGSKIINPGDEGWARIESSVPMIAVKKDRFILRRPSPSETIGGGEVVEEHPAKAFGKRRNDIIEQLEVMFKGGPDELVLQELLQKGPSIIGELIKSTHLSSEMVDSTVEQLLGDKRILVLVGDAGHINDSTLLIHGQTWDQFTNKLIEEIRRFHENNPLKSGALKEELRSRLKFDSKLFQLVLSKMVSDGLLAEDSTQLHLPDFKIRLTLEQNEKINQLQILFKKSPFQPPSVKECKDQTGEEIYKIWMEQGDYIQLNEDVVFRKKDLEKLYQMVLAHFGTHPTISVREFRDLGATSRKYALAVLEYLDKKGITRRDEDSRVLVKKRPLTD